MRYNLSQQAKEGVAKPYSSSCGYPKTAVLSETNDCITRNSFALGFE